MPTALLLSGWEYKWPVPIFLGHFLFCLDFAKTGKKILGNVLIFLNYRPAKLKNLNPSKT